VEQLILEGIQRLNAKSSKQKKAIEVARWLQSLDMAQYTQEFVSKGFDSLRTVSLLEYEDFQFLRVQPAHHQLLLYAAREMQRRGVDLPVRRMRGVAV
jgi:hypothetical protein